MKKVGTITFHWATNYGAVLQAYALQMFLKQNGFETEIIDYLPFQTMTLSRLAWIKKREFGTIRKERAIRKFRKKYLTVSAVKYRSYGDLCRAADGYGAVLSGSDQVMNFSFLKHAERGRTTPSYYLSFAGENTRKIAYAASFGTDRIPDAYTDFVHKELSSFDWVSVREESACAMLKEIGIESETVVDPTILAPKDIYAPLIDTEEEGRSGVFSYILHKNQKHAYQCESKLVEMFGKRQTDAEDYSVENWLKNIRNSTYVITNSFHATVFALLFHTPFITVSVAGSNMDNRLLTLLKMVGLEDRFLKTYDESAIEVLAHSNINWDEVDEKMHAARASSQQRLLKALHHEKR